MRNSSHNEDNRSIRKCRYDETPREQQLYVNSRTELGINAAV